MIMLKKIRPYLIVSLAVIGLCRLNTLTENYAWFPKGKELLVLDRALTIIFAYETVFCLIIANTAVFVIKRISKKEYGFAATATLLVMIFYFTIGKAVDTKCAFSYYNVFLNQSVSEEYLQSPIKEVGYEIGPFLTEGISDRAMKFRRYAISGLGDINYKPATQALLKILADKSEPDYIRSDAYEVLTKFNSKNTEKALHDFKLLAEGTTDNQVLQLVH